MVSVGESCDVGYVLEQQLDAAFMHGDDVETGFALPLYGSRSGVQDHFESRDPNCEGQHMEAHLGSLASVCISPPPPPGKY